MNLINFGSLSVSPSVGPVTSNSYSCSVVSSGSACTARPPTRIQRLAKVSRILSAIEKLLL